MTYEEVKKKLDELKDKKRLLRKRQKRIEEFKEQISLSALDYSAIYVQGGEGITPQEKYTERLHDMMTGFYKLLDEVMSDEDILNEAKSLLTPVEESIIIERYLNGLSWDDVGESMGYSKRQAQRYSKSGTKKLSKD